MKWLLKQKISTVLIFAVIIGMLPQTAFAAVGSWTFKPPFTGASGFTGAGIETVTLPDGNIFITGGATGMYGTSTNKTWLYNPNSDTYTPRADMAFYTKNHTMTVLKDGRVIALNNDGFNERTSNRLYYYSIYDPALDTWMFRDPKTGVSRTYQNWPFTFHTQDAAASTLQDGRAMFTGGWDSISEQVMKKVAFYNPTTGDWTLGPDMPVAKQGHWQVTLNDGRVAVGGGAGGVYIYSPQSNSWSQASVSLPGGDATLLADGQVLIIWSTGGIWGQAHETGGAIWNPATNSTATIVGLQEESRGAQVSALKDGTAIVIYGSNTNTYYVAARIFDANSAPTLSKPPQDQQPNDRVHLKWTFTDPDPGDVQTTYQIQGSTDNWATVRYDTGGLTGRDNNHTSLILPDGSWNFRVRASDPKGKWSNWLYFNGMKLDNLPPKAQGIRIYRP